MKKISIKNKYLIPLILLLLVLFLCLNSASAASNIYVNGSSGNNNNNGTSWQYAKATITDGISTVDNNGAVYVANGTYKENLNISKNLNLNGENQNTTIIDGTNTGTVITINIGNIVNIFNFTITNGQSSSNGGGINNMGTLNIENCTIENNNAYNGGGLYNQGTCTINNSTINNNTATVLAGGIYNIYQSNTEPGILNINNSNISYNNVPTGSASAIFNNGGATTINNTNFTNNTAQGYGAILSAIGTLTINNSTFTGNKAGSGGAMHIEWSNTIITNSTFTNNTVTDLGGAIHNDVSQLTITSSSFIGNQASNGGAIFCYLTPNTTLNFNRFYQNNLTTSTITNYGGTVDATNNWWGTNNDPNSQMYGPVNYSPWIIFNVNASPSTINTGQTSTITADLTKNSNNEDTTLLYPGKYVPDGIPVNFATTLGTIGSSSSTTNGVAQSTLNGGATPGVADVSAAADTETVHTTVNVETPIPTIVSSVDPVDGATNVPTNKVITVTFNKAIQAGSTYNSITVRRVSDNVAFTINKVISGNTLTITIPTAWLAGTQYKLYIPKTAITDLTANTLTTAFTSFFTTITPPVSPVVSSVDPVDGATNVPTNKVITVTFDKAIQAGSTYNSITVRRVSDNVAFTINKVISGNTLTITIPTAWLAGTQYKLYIPKTAITDLTANTLTTAFTSFFTTITPPVSPVVSSVDPVDGATNVPTNKVITVTFDKAIQAGSTYNSITVRRVSDNVAFTVNKVISGNTLTITIPTSWLAGTQYKLYIPKTAITDLTATTLTAAFTSYFTTI